MKITKESILADLRVNDWTNEVTYLYSPIVCPFAPKREKVRKHWVFTWGVGAAFTYNALAGQVHFRNVTTKKQFVDAIYKFLKEQL